MNNNLNKLLERYTTLYPARSLARNNLTQIEQKLDLVLPNDFKYITQVFDSYELVGNHTLYSFDPSVNGYNIVEKTLSYRIPPFMLPKRYIALEETEASFIAMETKSTPEEKTPVIYCSIEDAYNLAEGRPLEYHPTIFESFTDFFEYLIEQEEEERRLQGAGG